MWHGALPCGMEYCHMAQRHNGALPHGTKHRHDTTTTAPLPLQGLAMLLQCRDGKPEPGPGCGCSCVLALKSPPQDMGWKQQEQEALVPGSCFRQPRATGATNMVQVIARSFELRAQQDPRVPPAVPVPAQTRRGKAGACDAAWRRARDASWHGARS